MAVEAGAFVPVRAVARIAAAAAGRAVALAGTASDAASLGRLFCGPCSGPWVIAAIVVTVWIDAKDIFIQSILCIFKIVGGNVKTVVDIDVAQPVPDEDRSPFG